MERYDIAIIGTGPAGVSAAITAKVRGKRLILFGAKAMSDKVEKAHSILNYPGLPNVTGAQLAQAFSNHLESMDIPITEKQVTAVYAMGDYFAIQTPEEMIESRTVILAAGVVTAKALPGENRPGRELLRHLRCPLLPWKNRGCAGLFVAELPGSGFPGGDLRKGTLLPGCSPRSPGWRGCGGHPGKAHRHSGRPSGPHSGNEFSEAVCCGWDLPSACRRGPGKTGAGNRCGGKPCPGGPANAHQSSGLLRLRRCDRPPLPIYQSRRTGQCGRPQRHCLSGRTKEKGVTHYDHQDYK